MTELSFTIEDRASLPVLIDGRGGVRPAGLHERAMWKRIKELEAERQEVERLNETLGAALDNEFRAEEKLARLVEGLKGISEMSERLEWTGEFQRGEASGWNQCRAQIIALINEAAGEEK